ncbi:MAG: HNH endonuclease signature motif containing protein, partial [Acidimicrobiales bacterium]
YLARWRNHADEDSALDEYIANQAAQHFQYGFDLFGNVHYSGTVGPEHAEAFVETIETEAPKHRSGLNKPSQALGDALVELVLNPDGKYRAHLEILKPGAGEALTFSTSSSTAVPVPDPGFSTVYLPRTARGTLIPPAVVNRIQTKGSRVRVHKIDRDGNIVDDRASGRHFGAIQKRMIRLRDNRCRHPGCRRTARTCEYDHVEPFEQGGQTLVANGQLLCRFHHRWKHRNDPMGSRIFDDSPIQLE